MEEGGRGGRKKKSSTVTAATSPACVTLHGSVGPPLVEVNKTSAPPENLDQNKRRRTPKQRVEEGEEEEGRVEKKTEEKNGHYEFQK